MTKKIGKGMYEWAAKVDEYARGMVGPTGSTLCEELALDYIGPVDGHKSHNIEDLVCVLREVASLDSMGCVGPCDHRGKTRYRNLKEHRGQRYIILLFS